MNKLFQFFLTEEQIKILKKSDDIAIREAKKGNPGALFCQIGRTKGNDNMYLVRGGFIPSEQALRITNIINECTENRGGGIEKKDKQAD